MTAPLSPLTPLLQHDAPATPPVIKAPSLTANTGGTAGKPAAPGFLVCQGALCRCSCSALHAPIRVSSQQKFYVNDAAGVQRLVATDRDNNTASLSFGICTAGGRPEPCTAQLQWKVNSGSITLGNDMHPLLDSYTATCFRGGQVSVLHHGQQQQLGNSNLDNMSPALAGQHPMLAYEDVQQLQKPAILRPLSVTRICCGDVQSGGQPMPGLHVLPGKEATFSVAAYGHRNPQPTAAEKAQVHWVIYKGAGKGAVYCAYHQHGPVLSLAFEPGVFTVEAFGIAPGDAQCMLQVTAGPNRLLAISGPEKTLLHQPCTFTARFCIPAAPAPAQDLHWFLQDANGALLQHTKGAATFSSSFESEGIYRLKAFTAADASDAVLHTLKVERNEVKQLLASRTLVRPGDSVRFTALLQYGDHDMALLRWQEKGPAGIKPIPAGNGRPAIEHRFAQPGRYIITAATGDGSNACMQQAPAITVRNNAAVKITADRPPKTGAPLTFSVCEWIFPDLLPEEEQRVRWVLRGPESTVLLGQSSFSHQFEQPGNYVLQAYLYDRDKEATMTFTVITARVKHGKWMDGNRRSIHHAGYGQEVSVYFEHTGLEKETVELQVYDQDTLSADDLLLSRKITIPDNSRVYYSFMLTDDIRHKIENRFCREGLLYFRIKPASSLRIKDEGRNFPLQPADRLVVNRLQKIRSAWFTGTDGRERYRVSARSRELALQLYATNLVNEKLEIRIRLQQSFRNRHRPLEVYDLRALQDILRDDRDWLTLHAAVDSKGMAMVRFNGQTLPEGPPAHTIYALIVLPGGKGVYTESLLLYKAHPFGGTPAGLAQVVVEKAEEKEGVRECEKLVWGAKVGCAFRKKVVEIAGRLQADPNNLMACIALETAGTFDPSITNPLGYTGLIQFGASAADSLGTTTAALRKMQDVAQLDYVYRYLRPYTGRLNTLTDFYLAILMPADVGKGSTPGHIVFDSSTPLNYDGKGKVVRDTSFVRHYGYDANPAYKTEKTEYWVDKQGRKQYYKGREGKTYVSEIAQVIAAWYTRGIGYRNGCTCHATRSTTSQNWHEPLSDPQITLYMQSGGYWPKYAAFGYTRKETRSSGVHQGLDLFAVPGTPVYACLDGEVIYANDTGSGYGNMIIIRINDREAFLERKRAYEPKYSHYGEIAQGEGFNEHGEIYLRYAHLGAMVVKPGDRVKKGQVIGNTGKSGVASGTCAPHLHFEIASIQSPGRGLLHRVNPAYWVYYKHEATMSEAEKAIQLHTKNKGKL